jgi:uncharacterized protein YcbK (DUF882 family)
MKHFKRSEFACGCGCGFQTIDYELADILDDVRDHFGRPVRINSGCRCAAHNKRVGGSPGSQHVYGNAADFVVSDTPPSEVHEYLIGKYPGRLGIGKYRTWTHVDTRERFARWEK